MAVLSSKTTSGEDAFKIYVKNNPRYIEIDYVIENNMTAPLIVKEGSSFKEKLILKSGTKFKIIKADDIQIGTLRCAHVKYGSVSGFIPLNKIRKPTKGSAGLHYEADTVKSLNEQLKQIGRPISIKLGSNTFKNLSYAVQVDTQLKQRAGATKDPKCDIIICQDLKDPLKGTPIFISYKKEGGPEAFQQYGGLTESAGSIINSNPEVQSFLHSVVNYISDNKLTSPLMKHITDKKLMNQSIFGPEYGDKFSLQHVQLIAQGKPNLEFINESTYNLKFSSHMILSGDLKHFTGGYEPVFAATFRAGRGFTVGGKRINGARVGIYPKKLIASRGGLITLA